MIFNGRSIEPISTINYSSGPIRIGEISVEYSGKQDVDISVGGSIWYGENSGTIESIKSTSRGTQVLTAGVYL
jgi:hypothetical protein